MSESSIALVSCVVPQPLVHSHPLQATFVLSATKFGHSPPPVRGGRIHVPLLASRRSRSFRRLLLLSFLLGSLRRSLLLPAVASERAGQPTICSQTQSVRAGRHTTSATGRYSSEGGSQLALLIAQVFVHLAVVGHVPLENVPE